MAHLCRGLENYRECAELLHVGEGERDGRGGGLSQSSSKTESF
jgi:hypothetical protein